MNNKKLIDKWLQRAASNLLLAKTGRTSNRIFYEDLCFNAQQSVEKSLKSLFIYFNIKIPKSHNIGYLLEKIEIDADLTIPQSIKQATYLTEYSVQSRYPGDYYPLEEDDYLEAITIAEEVLAWVKDILDKQ